MSKALRIYVYDKITKPKPNITYVTNLKIKLLISAKKSSLYLHFSDKHAFTLQKLHN